MTVRRHQGHNVRTGSQGSRPVSPEKSSPDGELVVTAAGQASHPRWVRSQPDPPVLDTDGLVQKRSGPLAAAVRAVVVAVAVAVAARAVIAAISAKSSSVAPRATAQPFQT